tara:strand:+ start:664 stop:828 length:165 start_codon:yes stop_codon:yes gene_type:complete
MASVSFSVQQETAKNLDKYRKQYKLRSRTEAIAHLLKYRNSFKGNGLDQNGEPI